VINNSLHLNELGLNLNESSTNTIYQNKFTNFLDVIDKGTNIWNSSSAGNMWSKYAGEDANGDGIGDTPFVINETTGSMDYMPLMANETSSNSSLGKNSSENS
jgi:nitrous oxidase accessory protein